MSTVGAKLLNVFVDHPVHPNRGGGRPVVTQPQVTPFGALSTAIRMPAETHPMSNTHVPGFSRKMAWASVNHQQVWWSATAEKIRQRTFAFPQVDIINEPQEHHHLELKTTLTPDDQVPVELTQISTKKHRFHLSCRGSWHRPQ